jgi:conjugative transfer protein CagX
MFVRWAVLAALCLGLATGARLHAQSVITVHAETDGSASSASPLRRARTIVYHPRDLTPVRAKVRYTTLIVLPDDEDIVEATCGDKDVWIVNVRGGLVSVKPAKPRVETNLNLLTTSGEVYAFILTEVSDTRGQEPDFIVYLERDGLTAGAGAHDRPKYVRAEQVEEFREQANVAREDARRTADAARAELENGMTAFRTTYPLRLQFPYRFKADKSPFFIRAMFHDDHLTFIQARARELPAIYELRDGAPNLVNFEVRNGTYIVPKILDTGYFMLGKQRIAFERTDAR